MKTLDLVEPADGAVTKPLQRHPLPDSEKEGYGADGPATDWRRPQVVSPDRTQPRPVRLEWRRPAVGLLPVRYVVRLSLSSALDNPTLLGGILRCQADVWHLFIGTRYYWRVTAMRGGKSVAESSIRSFRTNDLPPRWINVSGITNVRDMGGWPLPGNRRIRQGLIYRSSEMNGTLELTRRGRRVLEDELGIKTDLDLRGGDENAPVLNPQKIRWINIPIAPYDCIDDDAFKENYRLVFEVLADASRYPIVFHCVGGADRGGTVAFLLNALLGKSKKNLCLDYELTSLSIWGERSSLSEAFNALLDVLSTYGEKNATLNDQVEAYLLSIGLNPETLEALRSHLIERM